MKTVLSCAILAAALGIAAVPAPAAQATAKVLQPLLVPADGSASAMLTVRFDGPVGPVVVTSYPSMATIPMLPTSPEVVSVVLGPDVLLSGYGPSWMYRNFAGWVEVLDSQ